MKKAQFPAVIRRRSGRACEDINVILEKPAEDYAAGESFELSLDNNIIGVHVEIPLRETADQILYVK
ncbi:MAG: hypothetical protein RL538_902 [Candidatus Parcubacteria bacterium]|jgi:hypothetical protein